MEAWGVRRRVGGSALPALISRNYARWRPLFDESFERPEAPWEARDLSPRSVPKPLSPWTAYEKLEYTIEAGATGLRTAATVAVGTVEFYVGWLRRRLRCRK
jgi:hypothetical protein